jgi:hypothetical protein
MVLHILGEYEEDSTEGEHGSYDEDDGMYGHGEFDGEFLIIDIN